MKTKYKVLEIFNECILLVLSYHFLLFYQIVTETARRKDLGYSLIALLSSLLVVNIMQIVGKLIGKTKQNVKKRYYKYKHDRAIKKKADALWEAQKLQEQANTNWLDQQMKLQAACALFEEDETNKPDLSITAIQDDNDRTHGGRLINTRIYSNQSSNSIEQ